MSFLDKVKSKKIEQYEIEQKKIEENISILINEISTDRINEIEVRLKDIDILLEQFRKDKKNEKQIDSLEYIVSAISMELIKTPEEGVFSIEYILDSIPEKIDEKKDIRKEKEKELTEKVIQMDVETKLYVTANIEKLQNTNLLPKKEVNEKLWLEIDKLQNEIGDINDDINILNKIRTFLNSKKSSIIGSNFTYEELEKIIKEYSEKKSYRINLESEKLKLNNEKKELLKEQEKTSEKIKEYRKKLTKIEDQIKEVKEAKSLSDFKYDTKEEAKRALEIETEDYIVIPISDDIEKVDDIFLRKVNLRIETDEILVNRQYISDSNNFGTVNSTSSIQSEQMAMLIPILAIDKENIIRVTSDGKIQLRKFDIPDDSIIVAPEGTQNEIINKLNTVYYKGGDIKSSIREFLGDNYNEDNSEYKYYSIFKNVIPKISKDKEKEVEIINSVLGENYYNYNGKEVLVNGNKYYSPEMKLEKKEKDIDQSSIDELIRIIGLFEDEKFNIDLVYGDLLREYMSINKNIKAQYNEERNTTILIKGKRCWINPKLPDDDNEIVNRAYRKGEDIIYKTMKLASLCNKIAHYLDDKQQDERNIMIRKKYFDIKAQLIKKVIELSKGKSDISIGKILDQRGNGIALDIPEYATIVLHTSIFDQEMDKLIATLPRYKYIGGKDHLETGEDDNNFTPKNPVMLTNGVNVETLKELKNIESKNISVEEARYRILSKLDNPTLQKLLVRLGYTAKDFSTFEGREKVIRRICTEDEIIRLIAENDIDNSR